jgi:FkbM family methyltransferase
MSPTWLTPTDDFADIALPEGVRQSSFRFGLSGGRDQIAAAVAAGGLGGFEAPLPAHLIRTVRTSPGLFIDVGANTGFYTLLAAAVSAEVRVLAVEPAAAIRTLLEANIAANGFAAQVTVLPMALSSRSGQASLFIPSQEHGLVETSASLEPGFKPDHSAVEQVPVSTLDALLLRRWPFLRVSVIKIDVEGHDAAVLRGAKWTIRCHRPVVFIEVLPTSDLDAMARLLERHRYTDLVLHADGVVDAGRQVRFDWRAWNHAFVPRERAASFIAASK